MSFDFDGGVGNKTIASRWTSCSSKPSQIGHWLFEYASEITACAIQIDCKSKSPLTESKIWM
eukprot:scaffold259099_cov35-Prasinocladus_malaysianus.AAC.10